MIAVGDVRANLQAVFDDHGFKRFNAAMVAARSRADKALRAELGANFDEEGFAKGKPGARARQDWFACGRRLAAFRSRSQAGGSDRAPP